MFLGEKGCSMRTMKGVSGQGLNVYKRLAGERRCVYQGSMLIFFKRGGTVFGSKVQRLGIQSFQH